MKPSANSIGVSKMMFPFQHVASQLRIFTPVGIATSIVAIMKKLWSCQPRPTVNMWCAQTSIEMNAMPTDENATAL